MPNLEIIKPGLMTTIQDMGRSGLAYYAIPQSGVMDWYSAYNALLLLNQPQNYPLIECTFLAPEIKFNYPSQIALTGANFNWTINHEKVGLNTILNLARGDVLKGTWAKDGLRGYLAINGKLKIEAIYNSYSTYIYAKMGRPLQAGDIISWTNSKVVLARGSLIIKLLSHSIVPLKPGPEFNYLTQAAQTKLRTNKYKISCDSNRMGARLVGAKLESSCYQLDFSLPVLPGFLQLPPSGVPIVLLQDGQVSGGYPRIAYIPKRHLAQFNQIPLNREFRFELLD